MTYAVEVLEAEKQRLVKERQKEAEGYLEIEVFLDTGGADLYVQKSILIRGLEDAIATLQEAEYE